MIARILVPMGFRNIALVAQNAMINEMNAKFYGKFDSIPISPINSSNSSLVSTFQVPLFEGYLMCITSRIGGQKGGQNLHQIMPNYALNGQELGSTGHRKIGLKLSGLMNAQSSEEKELKPCGLFEPQERNGIGR
jgi:hypothetical protein